MHGGDGGWTLARGSRQGLSGELPLPGPPWGPASVLSSLLDVGVSSAGSREGSAPGACGPGWVARMGPLAGRLRGRWQLVGERCPARPGLPSDWPLEAGVATDQGAGWGPHGRRRGALLRRVCGVGVAAFRAGRGVGVGWPQAAEALGLGAGPTADPLGGCLCPAVPRLLPSMLALETAACPVCWCGRSTSPRCSSHWRGTGLGSRASLESRGLGSAGRAWAVGGLVVSAKGDGFPPKAQEGGGREVPGECLVGHGPGSHHGGFRARPSPILPAQVGSSLRAPGRRPAELWGQLPAGSWPSGVGEAPFPERVTSEACSGPSGSPACVWNERPWRVEPRPRRLLPALRRQPAPSGSARTAALGVCFSQLAPAGVRHGRSTSEVVVGGGPGSRSEGSWRSWPHGSRREACEGVGHRPQEPPRAAL